MSKETKDQNTAETEDSDSVVFEGEFHNAPPQSSDQPSTSQSRVRPPKSTSKTQQQGSVPKSDLAPPQPPPKPNSRPLSPIPEIRSKKMGTIGTLQAFDPSKDDYEMWYATFTNFLVANELSPEDASDKKRCVGIFLSSIGITTYTLLNNLLAPAAPASKSLSHLNKTLLAYYKPAPKALAERFKFTGRKQKQGESANEFLAALRTLAVHCKFTSDLETRIRDQFIFGLSSEAAQRSLFTKNDDISLSDVQSIVVAQEAAEASTALVRGRTATSPPPPEQVHKTTKSRYQQQHNSNSNANSNSRKNKSKHSTSSQSKKQDSNSSSYKCYGCGSGDHLRNKCPHHDKVCDNCGKSGHLAKVCKSSKSKKTNHVSPLQVQSVHSTTSNKIQVEVTINGKPHSMEFDTGCESSLLSKDFWEKTLHRPRLERSVNVFRSYTNNTFRPLGDLNASIQYNGQIIKHSIAVTSGTSLFGRDLIRAFQIDWKHVAQQCNNVSDSTSRELHNLLKEYSDIFEAPSENEKIRKFKAQIILRDDATPRFLKARPIPYSYREKVDKELDLMEKTGVISKIETSDWASPLVVVPKPDGRVRITVDFKHTVNPQLCVTQYPLSNPDDLFTTVAGGSSYSKFDGNNAYHQIELDEASKKFLVINTHRGLYKYNVLVQGIASAPAIFQQFMDQMLKGIPRTGSYIDDGITTGMNDTEHLQNLRKIFSRMRAYNYKLSKNKCEFLRSSLNFLGHRISTSGIETTSEKVEDIQKMPTPTTVTQVRSFTGLANFYAKFIPNLQTVCEPLYRLTRDDVPFHWDNSCERAFSTVKTLVSSSPVLGHFDSRKSIGISCDASSIGLGVVLFQRDSKGTEQPLSFASKLLSDTERRYSQIEKEGLAIKFGIEKFFKFLCGRTFILVTDHKPLLTIFGPKSQLPPFVATRLHHWALFLSQFNYKVEYRKSEEHGNADALSRLPNPSNSKNFSEATEAIVHHIRSEQLDVLPITASKIRNATSRDPVLSKVLQLILYGWPPKLREEDQTLQPYFSRRQELSIVQGIIMWGVRVVIPTSLRLKILGQLHECHFGMVRMKAIARQHVYWPGIDKEIEDTAKSCVQCRQSAANPASAPLHPWMYPEKPWQRLHMDLAGPFLNQMWLIVVDANTKWPEVFMMHQNTTSHAIISKLSELFARFGIPEQLVSDNGRQFISAELQAFCKSNNIKQSFSSVYHPRSNGEAERFVRTFKESMKSGTDSPHARLQKFLLQYRSSPHTTTGSCPSELLLGRKLRTLLDLVHPDPAATTRSSQLQQEKSYNQNVKMRAFNIHDHVWVKSFSRGEEKWSLGFITAQVGPLTYDVDVSGKTLKRHADQIRKAHHATSASTSVPDSDDDDGTCPTPAPSPST